VSATTRTTVLFVCTGNICRSPMAEVIATQRAALLPHPDGGSVGDVLEFKSAGTAAWHVGEPMDPRAAAVLKAAGFDPDHHRAQHASDSLLAQADVIVALDRKHAQILKGRVSHDQIILLRSQDPMSGGRVDVADPYYGDDADFEECLKVVTAGVEALISNLASS
jgi:protein-tyrosine phosphatase